MAYKSAYSKAIAGLTNKVVNRKAFTYDPTTDASYQALSKQYGMLGDRARADTMADVAGNTGGIVSSWAVTAGQQAQNNYNQELTNQIPSLMEAAYTRYNNENTLNTNALSSLQSLNDSAYSQYADNRDYNYTKKTDNRSYNYTKTRDKISDSQWLKEYNLEKKNSVSSSSSGSSSSGSKKTSSTKKKTAKSSKLAAVQKAAANKAEKTKTNKDGSLKYSGKGAITADYNTKLQLALSKKKK